MRIARNRRCLAIVPLLLLLLLPPLPMPARIRAEAGGTWQPTGQPAVDRHDLFTATTLPDGTVVVAGGNDGAPDWPNPLGSAERYDPATGSWRATGDMVVPRFWHTATALPSGTVLAIGGWGAGKPEPLTSTVEAYDPATGTWRAAGSLASGKVLHTATLLADGTILVIDRAGAERYDPATGLSRPVAPPTTARDWHTATLLPDGSVLVAGGEDDDGAVGSAERYDPRTDSWHAAGALNEARFAHTATLLADGTVLVAGGETGTSDAAPLSSSEIYDPVADTWRVAGHLNARRANHSATLLPDGTVIALGGHTAVVERYLPASGTWVADPAPIPPGGRAGDIVTAPLRDGTILASTGDRAMRYLPGAAPAAPPPVAPFPGSWQSAGAMTTARQRPAATLLADGTALVVGGNPGQGATAERYDPASNAWRPAGSLRATGVVRTVAPLADGGALVLGSSREPCPCVATSERYDPGTGDWRATAPPPFDFFLPQVAVLPGGPVLVVGSSDEATYRYDPDADAWRAAGAVSRLPGSLWALVALPDGAVLLLTDGAVARYDPPGNRWVDLPTPSLPAWSRAVAIGDGTILLLGQQEAGIYDPARATWRVAPVMAADRGPTLPASPYTLTTLPGALVVAAGGRDMAVRPPGDDARIPLGSAEVFDAAAGAWRPTASLGIARTDHTALALRDGSALVFGGFALDGRVPAPERFVPGGRPPSPSPVGTPPAGAATYRLTDLGPLIPAAINAPGQVAGTLPTGRAAAWRDGAVVELAGDGSAASGLNDRGWVVGQTGVGTREPRAVLWRDGAALDLAGRPAGAAAVNVAGRVVGWLVDVDDGAFAWQDGVLALLEAPPPGDVRGSAATGINARGDVIGSIGKGEPVVWRDGHLRRLGALAGWWGQARAINDDGQIVGVTGTPSGQDHAVLWQDGIARDLGTLGGSGSEARGINAWGQIVGGARTAAGANHAFLYQAGAMTDLNTLLAPGDAWELTLAVAINDGGQIAGIGLVGGVARGFLLTPVAPVARFFPETGQAVGPPFLAYWQVHGGLPIDGFPISPAFTATLEDGKDYLVQYFERVRMEYHPENDPPYDILLGQFGRQVLAGVPGAPTAPVAASPGAVYFAETGHNIARPGFAAYWAANGGLAQFGYPLSEEFTETLEDGRDYRVQYFERARFEWHPENAPPYDILLGQFGRRVLAGR